MLIVRDAPWPPQQYPHPADRAHGLPFIAQLTEVEAPRPALVVRLGKTGPSGLDRRYQLPNAL